MTDDSTPEVDFEPLPDRQAGEDELGDAVAFKAKVKKIRDELEKAKKERQEYLDGWQRCKADSINTRKEALSSAERSGDRKLEQFVEELIPVLDGFHLAAGSPSWEEIGAEWKSGVEQIHNHMLDVLERHGVKRFGKIGEAFDPGMHEAIQEVSDAPGESHSIVRILRYGYKKGERILRPAQVVVKV